MGLTLVKKIAEFHQGKLSFESSPLGGLLVKVQLPILKVDDVGSDHV
ncbi:HAMP domain-containing histidine kinase [Psychromonas hadalis]